MKTGEREGQTYGRRKDAAEEELCTGFVVEMCSSGHEAHLHHGKLQVILLPASQPGPAKPFSAGGWSPPASPWPMPMPCFFSSEVKHLLSHGKSANTAPAKGQTAWMYTLCFTGMNKGHPSHCATREEKKRICRSPRQMRLLLTCFFACYFT